MSKIIQHLKTFNFSGQQKESKVLLCLFVFENSVNPKKEMLSFPDGKNLKNDQNVKHF
jgi:hypothetical protein